VLVLVLGLAIVIALVLVLDTRQPNQRSQTPGRGERSRWAVLARQPPLAVKGRGRTLFISRKRGSFTNHGSIRQRGPERGPGRRALPQRLRRTL